PRGPGPGPRPPPPAAAGPIARGRQGADDPDAQPDDQQDPQGDADPAHPAGDPPAAGFGCPLLASAAPAPTAPRTGPLLVRGRGVGYHPVTHEGGGGQQSPVVVARLELGPNLALQFFSVGLLEWTVVYRIRPDDYVERRRLH